jgi:hypothetical protein
MQLRDPAQFQLPLLSPVLATLKAELTAGRGFYLIKGLPVQRWSREQVNFGLNICDSTTVVKKTHKLTCVTALFVLQRVVVFLECSCTLACTHAQCKQLVNCLQCNAGQCNAVPAVVEMAFMATVSTTKYGSKARWLRQRSKHTTSTMCW